MRRNPAREGSRPPEPGPAEITLAQTIAFYVISAILIFSALMVVTQRSLFTCALYLAAALSSMAGLFILLSADFLAAVQILVYVGGILVILAFAVMLSSAQQAQNLPQVNRQWLPSLVAAGGILALVLYAIQRHPFEGNPASHGPTTVSLGHLLLRDLSLPFEAVSLILLASLAGAVIFSKKEAPENPS